MTATIIISKILSNPNTIMLLSMASVAFLEAKIKMAKAPLKIPPPLLYLGQKVHLNLKLHLQYYRH